MSILGPSITRAPSGAPQRPTGKIDFSSLTGRDQCIWYPVYRLAERNENEVRLNSQIADLHKRLAESETRVAVAEKVLRDERETHTMQLAAISTATMQNTRETTLQRIKPGTAYTTQAYLDVCRAIDREIAHREARCALERELEDWRQSREDLMQRLAAVIGLGGSFARQVAETAMSVSGLYVEDHRVANAVAAERERIFQRIGLIREALMSYPRPWSSFWRKLWPSEAEERADVGADALHTLSRALRTGGSFDVLRFVRGHKS